MLPPKLYLTPHPLLITMSRWFRAPDGREYRAVWGTIKQVLPADTKAKLPGMLSIGSKDSGRMLINPECVETAFECANKPKEAWLKRLFRRRTIYCVE